MALENRKKKKNLISEHSEFWFYLRGSVRSDVFYSCTGLKKKCFFRFASETSELKPIYS